MTITTPSVFAIGAVIAETYQLTRLIGQGGMGAVWEANHLRLPGKRVALKVLLNGEKDPQMLARFRREAEIASRLGHPNIVQIIDFNTLPDGVPYIVLELLTGESLSARLARGPMPMADALAVVRQIGSALQAAHREGIIHRDLKPENMFLCPTEIGGEIREIAKVLDFGISKMRDASTVLTQGASVMGTPKYMAPEQAMGHNDDIDARTDVFSFGAVVYEMLGGRSAFGGDSLAAVVHAVVYAPTPPLGSVAPHLPSAVAGAVDKALSKNPAERFPDVASFVNAVTGRPLETLSRAAAISGTDRTQALTPSPVSPASSTVATGATQAVGSSHASLPPTASHTVHPEAARSRRRSSLIIALAALAGLGLAGALFAPRLLSKGPSTNAGDDHPLPKAEKPAPDEPLAGPKPALGKPAPDKPATDKPGTEDVPAPRAGQAQDLPRGQSGPGTVEPHPRLAGPPPASHTKAEKDGAPLASSTVADLSEAEKALTAGSMSEAIRLAQHSLLTQKSSRAYALIARGRCLQGDLGNAKAAFAKVAKSDRPAVLRACHTQNLDLR